MRAFHMLRFPWLLLIVVASTARADDVDLPPDHAQKFAAGLEMFDRDVKELLKKHCVACHGGEKTRGDLDLATREGLLKGGGSGKAVVPFKAADSLLVKLITHAEQPAMPDEQPKLPDDVIQKISTWIDHGAPYNGALVEGKRPPRNAAVVTDDDKKWWAFQALAKVDVPQIEKSAELRNDIDRFIQAKALAAGKSILPPADKRRLIRRAYFDLLGLPPSPAEIESFVADESAEAWPKLIDRLLDNPAFGERWARHWLDVARFAESHGFEHDYDRPGAWAFRDFAIKAINSDMPYNQFIHWQLAGDELAADNALALSATGFLGAGVFPTQITENEVERTRYDAMDDMLSTTGSAFLGLTVGCARCHDHKFDPIPTADYYRMLSTFTTTVRSNIDVDLDPAKTEEMRKGWAAAHQPLVDDLAAYEATLPAKFDAWFQAGADVGTEPTWSVLALSETKSQAGATFKPLDDGSYLAEGTNGGHDVYNLSATLSLKKPTGLKLEALTHPTMTKGGPGRAPNGNIGLSKIRVFVQDKEVKIAKAEADFEQNNSSLAIAASLDENDSTGWAVDPQFGKDHAAVFTFAEPVDFEGSATLRVELTFKLNGQHNIGRPRLSVIAGAVPSLKGESIPADVAAILAAAKDPATRDKVTAEQKVVLLNWWKRRDADWRTRSGKVEKHLAERPNNLTKILICGEGYPAMRHHTQGADFFDKTFHLERGSTDRKKDVAQQGFLQVMLRGDEKTAPWLTPPPANAKFSGRRTAMAKWITDLDQGAGALAARVAVNRLWQHHFGAGIVPSANDFGRTGTAATHPELLEWLAGQLVAHDWKPKSIHRLIMNSAAYRQAPSDTPDLELVVGRKRHRLEAETIRDALLAVSGQLDKTMYGPGTLDENSRRRSIYFTMKRSQLVGSMVVFDQPEPLVSQGSRPVTTVAPQALLLLNGSQVRAGAKSFAEKARANMRIEEEFDTAVRNAYMQALGREPSRDELADAVAFLNAQAASYQADGRGDARILALTDFCQAVLALNEFAYVE